MPRLGADEFETDDEWSFISPSAKAHDSRSDSIDGPSAAYEQFRGRISAASKQQQAQRQPVAGGSQRQSAAAKRSGDVKKSSYTYAHRLPPETRSADGDSYGYATSSDERKSAAGGGGGGRLLDQSDWWEPGTRMGQQRPRAPLTSGPSSYSSLRGAGADDARVNGHSKENFSTKDRRRRTRARVQEALHVTDGGRLFLESADGYEDGGQATDDDLDDALEAWLAEDESHGFIRVYSPPGSDGAAAAVVDGGSEATLLSRLIPCTTAAEAHEICHVAGLQPSSLHVQLNGDVVRRLDAYERPLAMQNDYLTRIGYSDPRKIQKEGLSTELGYLIRFYSGKSFDDSTYARRQLSSVIDVKTGGILQRWSKRLCAISGTKLTIHKGTDRSKESETTTIQLAKGSVEEVKVKGHGYCIKLSTSGTPQKIVFLSFETQNEFSKWLKKARKATAKLPSSADLSGCNLEFLPESVYTNDQLTVLNLRHNALRPMPTEENIYTIGWLDDISRFKHLRSLNLADNGLDFFPPAICDIISLVELNVATNRIAVVPAAISQLMNLQALHLHNNHLSTLPHEITLLKKLAVLVLAFNKFRSIPSSVAMLTDVRVSECDTLVMAGNSIDSIPGEVIAKLKHVKRIDLRMNNLVLPLSETVKFNQMEHLTHLDIRDNRAIDLDLRYVKMLEYLNCERNGAKMVQLHGGKLKTIIAAKNDIQQIIINPKPEWLETMDFSRNRLEKLPEWLPECFFLTKLNVCYNRLALLPQKMFSESPKLKLLQADHNRLKSLPSEMGSCVLEEVYLHANQLQELPQTFLSKTNKLRLLNVSGNQLTTLPPASEIPDLNKLHELYLTSNNLHDDCLSIIARYGRLKVLHIAHNSLHFLPDKFISALDMLQELNISANQIEMLPSSLGELEHLTIIRAHSNKITRLPRLDTYKSLVVFDVSCNPLQNISAGDLMNIGKVQALDLSSGDAHNGNSLDTNCRGCLKRSKELLYNEQPHPSECELTHVCEVGIAESHGSKSKLCVATLNAMQLYDRNEALFGVVDGGKNDEIARTLKNSLPHILNEELVTQEENGCRFGGEDDYSDLEYMKYTFLAAHKKLKHSAQRLGASVLLCHLFRDGESDGGRYRINVANVGDARAVVSRRGEAVQLSRDHIVPDDRDECRRIGHNDGIITEEGKVNGITHLSRCIGNSYLYPQMIPLPSLTSERLRMAQDEFLIIANGAFWRHVTYGEAVQVSGRANSSASSAKSLLDLAQAYGCPDNIGIVVVRFGPKTASCRPAASMAVEPRSEADCSTTIRASHRQEPQPQAEDNYVNLETLRLSGHIPSPWDGKLSRRPMPTPRSSLVKVFSSAASVNGYGDDDYTADPGRDNAHLNGSRPSAAPPQPQPMWSTSIVRNWQFRSDGFLVNPVPSDSSSSSSSSASQSSTLTCSSTEQHGVAPSDGEAGDGDEIGSQGRLTAEARNTAQQSRLRRRRGGRVVADAPNGRLRRRRRLCSSDTRLQYPSAIELKGSDNYFNRPALVTSSQESFLPDEDWQEDEEEEDAALAFDEFDGDNRWLDGIEGRIGSYDGRRESVTPDGHRPPAASIEVKRLSAGQEAVAAAEPARPGTSGGEASAREYSRQPTTGLAPASFANGRGGSSYQASDGLRNITSIASAHLTAASSLASAVGLRGGSVSGAVGGGVLGSFSSGVYRAWPRAVVGAASNGGRLSEADVRALQTYSDASLLAYKDDPVQQPLPEPSGGRTSAGGSGLFYCSTDSSQRSAAAAGGIAATLRDTQPSTPVRMPVWLSAYQQAARATPVSAAVVASERLATASAVAVAKRSDSGREPPTASGTAEAVSSAAARPLLVRASSATEPASQRLHPGVHQIGYYNERPAGGGQRQQQPADGKGKGSAESSSAYGSLTWSSSTVSHYDTYL